MLRYLDAPRRDPTAHAALRLLADKQRETPRVPTLKRKRRETLTATVEECLAAKGRRIR